MSNYKIPFGRNGEQQHYPEPWYTHDPETKGYQSHGPDWRDNFEFTDTLVYEGYARGRSAAYFLFRRASTGTQVTMFMKELDSCIRCMSNGIIGGRWTFVKQGMNYSVRRIGDE